MIKNKIYPKICSTIELQKDLIKDIYKDCKYYERKNFLNDFEFYTINEELMFENIFNLFLPFMFENFNYKLQRDDRFLEERFKQKNKKYKDLPFKKIYDYNENYSFLPLQYRDFHNQKDLFKKLYTDDKKFLNKIEEDKRISWTVLHVNTTDIFLYQMALRGYSLKKIVKS